MFPNSNIPFQTALAILLEQRPVVLSVLIPVVIVPVPQVTVDKCVLLAYQDGTGHLQIAAALVKVLFCLLIFNFNNIFLWTDCSCNTAGTTSGSSECADTSGDCTCATGYSGQMCDSCISGWYWTSTASTCTGKIDKYNCLNVKHV